MISASIFAPVAPVPPAIVQATPFESVKANDPKVIEKLMPRSCSLPRQKTDPNSGPQSAATMGYRSSTNVEGCEGVGAPVRGASGRLPKPASKRSGQTGRIPSPRSA